MELRDELAVRRTVLANQRTLLTFSTASLALVITGLTLIKFFEGTLIFWAGLAFLPAGGLLLFFGVRNYFSHQRMIEAACKKSPP
ncbi:MAG: DUF202 domain-containing protein [Candidatus Omnitrophota bacterium]